MSYINKERLLSLFCKLAKIKSPSGQEEELARIVCNLLSAWGLDVVRDSYGNIIAKLAGKGEPLIFCAHLDTVAIGSGEAIKPVRKDDIITSDGSTILGADNKGAITAMLEVLQILSENNLPHRSLEIVLTREEEAISRGAQNLDISLLAGKECIIADHAEPYGTIVLGAPCCFRFMAQITGRRSHVKEPEKGVNALLIASKAIIRLPLGRIDELTTTNIAYQTAGLQGVIDQAGRDITSLATENRNTVPDQCLIYGEARGIHEVKVLATLSEIQRIFAEEAGALGGALTFRQEKLSHGYVWDQSDPLVVKVADIFQNQGVIPCYHYAVGGSDANTLNQRGIRSVVVSSAHRNSHQCSEYLIIDDLVRLADFFLRLAIIN